ncbi:hypothetical protein [Streptomyces sp. NPDC004728]|uniref:hypothetical protein n=1 Tax=Streptomyces sp. NPDC004728 TaxID=3154289 RepID=UPI00339DF541
MLSDEGAFEAVKKLIHERGEPSPAGSLTEAAGGTRFCLVEVTVVRFLETRTQEERFHAGPLDLSGRPVFDTTIYSHSIPPPRDPSREYTLTLVQRDSADERVLRLRERRCRLPTLQRLRRFTLRDTPADRIRKLADLLPEPGALPDDQTATVAATWSLSIERADQLRPAGLARPMLQLATMLDPNGVPRTVLTSEPARA